MEERRGIFAFTVTRATSAARCRLLQETLVTARRTAGTGFYWYVYGSGVGAVARGIIDAAKDIGVVDEHYLNDENVGQHVAWNAAFKRASSLGYKHFVRIDDDCEFISKRWLKKLHEASCKLNDKFILAPLVRGLRNPPEKSNKVEANGVEFYLLRDAIGGICRWHPMELLTRKDDPFIADVRKPLGSGDATGIAAWAKRHVIPFAYLSYVRVRHAHSTAVQEAEDAEHFATQNMFQHVPYIPDGKSEQRAS